MATPQQIRDAIDSRLAALWPVLVNRQNTYFGLRGRYFQGLKTHSDDPVDGSTAAANQLALKPSYQAEDWTTFGVASWTESFSIEIHQYEGSRGKGWVAFVRVTISGRTFVRSWGQGPENRDQSWVEQISPFLSDSRAFLLRFTP